MSAGFIFLLFSLLSLSGLGICHKVADFQRCKPSAVSVMMFAAAGAMMWIYTLYKVMHDQVPLFPPFNSKAVTIALLCGACAGMAILTFQIGVRYGRISTSWLVINLSVIIPAGLSLIIFQEWKNEIKWQEPVALGLIMASVVLLWLDKTVEIARGEEPIPQRPLQKRPGEDSNRVVTPGQEV